MPQTPQRFPGIGFEEDQIQFYDRGSHSDKLGALYRFGGDLFGRDAAGFFNLRSGSGITEAQHELLDTIVHALNETCFEEITRTGGKITDVVWYTTDAKTTKVREINLTRSGGKVSVIVCKQYNAAGALLQTLTGTTTRTSGRVSSIDWVET